MFRPNPRAQAELRHDPAYNRMRRRVARDVVDHAELIAPVGQTGNYKDSLDVGEDGETIAATSSDFAAHWVEFGSIHNPAYAPLRRAARAVGLDLRD